MQNESNEALLLEVLSNRRKLTSNELEFQRKFQAGKAGEEEFLNLLAECCPNLGVIVDFQQQLFHQEFQIDALVCAEQTLYHFEIKNYDFNVIYRNGQAFIGNSQKTLSDPFRQLKRNKDSLRQLLQNYPENIEVVSFVVFIHENCEVTVDEPFARMSLSRLDLLELLKKLSFEKANKALQNWLKLQHSPLNNLHYTYEKLDMALPVQSGLICKTCGTRIKEAQLTKLRCSECQEEILKNDIKADLIKEYALLFPWKTLYSTQIARFYDDLITQKAFDSYLQKAYQKKSSKRRSGYHNPYSVSYQLAQLYKLKNDQATKLH